MKHLIKQAFKLTMVCINLYSFIQSDYNFEQTQKKYGIAKVISSERICHNYAPHVQDEQLLFLKDGTLRIYNSSTDSLYPEVYEQAVLSNQSCALKTSAQWVIKMEDFEDYPVPMQTAASFPAEQYDSIRILGMFSYIGFKDSIAQLFSISYDSLKVDNSVTLPAGQIQSYNTYEDGIFIRLNSDNKIHWIDTETGRPKSNFAVDSIDNLPNVFQEASIVKNDGVTSVYFFPADTTVESSVTNYDIVPIYEYPLVIKPDYIAFGDQEWVTLDIKNVVDLKYDIWGDFVNLILTDSKGIEYVVDLWTKEVTNTIRP